MLCLHCVTAPSEREAHGICEFPSQSYMLVYISCRLVLIYAQETTCIWRWLWSTRKKEAIPVLVLKYWWNHSASRCILYFFYCLFNPSHFLSKINCIQRMRVEFSAEYSRNYVVFFWDYFPQSYTHKHSSHPSSFTLLLEWKP